MHALAIAALAGTIQVDRLIVHPARIRLDGPRDAHRLLVIGIDTDGLAHDLGTVATIDARGTGELSIDGTAVRPMRDGDLTLVVDAGGRSVEVPVSVTGASAPIRNESFRLDVLPVLTWAGCSTGPCHGSARGQDGFHLSLFGFDPAADLHAILREQPLRRVDLARPSESLLLRKATGEVSHTGGALLDPTDVRLATVRRWLEQGAQDDPPGVPSVVSVGIAPEELTLAAGTALRIGVTATYSDGTDRDVTSLATMSSSAADTVSITGEGLMTAHRPGEAHVLARFAGLAVGTSLVVVDPAAKPAPVTDAGGTWIDAFVDAKLRRMRIPASPRCTDEEFLRRATIDLVGLLPTPAEHAAFVADPSPDKRRRLVDGLVARPEFTDIWVMKWSERLGIRSNNDVSAKATLLYATWLRQQLASGVPIDRVVRSILSSEGGTFDSPATNFYQLERDPLKLAENVAQAFVGTRLQCAQCHNHPFDRWTMDDYYGHAAFFAQVGRKPGEDPRETVVFNAGSGETRHPVGGRVVAPKFLGGPPMPAGSDRRKAFAEWLTAPDNPMFARNVANFVWAHFLGEGLVEPVDDVRASNPASNEPLLAGLAARLVADGFDVRQLVRAICASEAYQRSTKVVDGNAADTRNLARARIRRIRAECLLDCISMVTGTQDKFDGLPLGARAVRIADGSTSTYFLTTFGRARRETVCTCEVSMEPSLSQALNLINGDTVAGKVKAGGVVARALASGETPSAVLDRLFIATLTRLPRDEERSAILAEVATAPSAQEGLEDAFWAILNSREFIFNH